MENLHVSEPKTKVGKVLIRDKRDAALTAHSDSSAPLLVASLVSPPVSRRPTSLAKKSAAPQASPSATTLSRRWRSSLT